MLSYDITDDKRRGRIAKLMERHGDRVQKSVFECRIDAERLAILVKRASRMLDKKTDTLRVYRLCRSCEAKTLCIGCGDVPSTTDVLIA